MASELSYILESNIKRYKDEKKLEERRHEELLQRKENKIPVFSCRNEKRFLISSRWQGETNKGV